MTPGSDGDGISTPASLDHRETLDQRPQLDDLDRRLRAWSSASWDHGNRLTATRLELQALADASALAAGRPLLPVPMLEPTVIPDQLVVLADQAMQDGVDPAPYLARIAAALGFSR